jgi:hypothetical protein
LRSASAAAVSYADDTTTDDDADMYIEEVDDVQDVEVEVAKLAPTAASAEKRKHVSCAVLC